jgi:hypothetical protein
MNNKRITISLALIVLVCFFLPWIQVSCGASKDRLTGVDLAQDGHNALWLIPIFMIAVLFINIVGRWKDRREVSALSSLIGGLISAYLMNRERVRAEDISGLIAVGVTGWFWLGLASTLGLVITAALPILKRKRTS